MTANFEDLKKSLKKSLLVEIKIFFGNFIALCVHSDEKIKKKFVMATLNLKKSKKNNFAGGPFRQFGLKLSARPTITNF